MRRATALLLPLIALGCARPLVVRPPEETQRQAPSGAMVEALRRLGRPGDWLVRRGYHGTDDAISALTHSPFSHAAILDLERDQVVEADGRGGVHTTPLADFARASHRVWLLRPRWSSPERGAEAVRSARSLVGRTYDFTGLAGLNARDRYYCSELCVAVYRPWIPRGTRIPPVIPPGHMHDWATVCWDSGPRD